MTLRKKRAVKGVERGQTWSDFYFNCIALAARWRTDWKGAEVETWRPGRNPRQLRPQAIAVEEVWKGEAWEAF